MLKNKYHIDDRKKIYNIYLVNIFTLLIISLMNFLAMNF
jgi:hypothetical protein